MYEEFYTLMAKFSDVYLPWCKVCLSRYIFYGRVDSHGCKMMHEAVADKIQYSNLQTSISQLMEQISAIKMENKQIISCFDQLATQMDVFMSSNQSTSLRCYTGGHASESSQAKWWACTLEAVMRSMNLHVALQQGNHPSITLLFLPWIRRLAAQVVMTDGSNFRKKHQMSLGYSSKEYWWGTKGVDSDIKINAVQQFLSTHLVDIFTFTEAMHAAMWYPIINGYHKRPGGGGNGTIEPGV